MAVADVLLSAPSARGVWGEGVRRVADSWRSLGGEGSDQAGALPGAGVLAQLRSGEAKSAAQPAQWLPEPWAHHSRLRPPRDHRGPTRVPVTPPFVPCAGLPSAQLMAPPLNVAKEASRPENAVTDVSCLLFPFF